VIDVACLAGAGYANQTAMASGGAVCERAELLSWAFSFVTNGTCTVLIGYKLWCVWGLVFLPLSTYPYS
jgi:hypothetical protein